MGIFIRRFPTLMKSLRIANAKAWSTEASICAYDVFFIEELDVCIDIFQEGDYDKHDVLVYMERILDMMHKGFELFPACSELCADFKPMEATLVRNTTLGPWELDNFRGYDADIHEFLCVKDSWKYCIPFDTYAYLLEDPPKGVAQCSFTPFQKVLVRDDDDDPWGLDFFSHYVEDSSFPYMCLTNEWTHCIAYEGNEFPVCGQFFPFQQVLVRDGDDEKWGIDFFSSFDVASSWWRCMEGTWSYCIPFKGHEHLLGTRDDDNE